MNDMNAEFSLGPFCNWFLPSCLDIWSSGDGQQVLVGYGARSSLCLLNITNNKSIESRDSVNVFNSKSIISSAKFSKKCTNGAKSAHIFIGSNDGEAAIMDCNSNQIIRQNVDIDGLDLPSKKILSADWSHASDGSVVYYCIHSLIIEWNIKTQNVKQLKIGENFKNQIAISCIASSNCGEDKLAIGYMNGDLTIVYLKNYDYFNGGKMLSGHNDDICSLSFGWSKGQYTEGILASISRDGFVKVWDIERRYNIADVKLDAMKAKHKNWFSLAVLPNIDNNNKFEILIGSGNGNLLTIEIPGKPPDSKIRVHKPLNFSSCKSLSHSTVVFSIAIDVNNMLAITTSLDHQIIVWDLKERKAVNSFHTLTHGVRGISMSPIDPSLLAIAIGDGFQIIKFNEDLSVKYQHRFPFFKKIDAKGVAVVWHPVLEHRLAIASSMGEINVIDVHSSQTSTKYRTKQSLYETTKVYGLVWGPSLDGSEGLALYCVHQSGNLYLHYPSSDKVSPFTNYINEKKKRSEIRWKSSFTHFAVGNEDGTVDVFEYKDKKLNILLKINAYKKCILCLTWNSNIDEEISNWLAVSSYDHNIYCYSLNDYFSHNYDQIESNDSLLTISKPSCILSGHSDRVTSMSWCPFDSNKLVSVSYDRSAHIWDVINENLLIKFCGHRGILYCVQWSAFDKDLIFSGGDDNYFHAWRPSKQSFKISDSVNGFEKHSSNGINALEWPHLEVNPQSNDEIISRVVNNCINHIVSNESSCALNHDLDCNTSVVDLKKQKSKIQTKVTKKKINKENKKISLFPINNSIEYSSTKYQKIEDIEALFEKLNGINVSKEKLERILLYGDCNDIKLFISNEVSHHEKQGNKEQRDILNLLLDVKSAVEQSLERKEMNSHLVSLSASVSRKLWKESCQLYAQLLAQNSNTEPQTYKLYKIEMSAIFLLSQNNVNEAIDLLLKNDLYREALIVAKLKFASDKTIEHIISCWADHRENNGDCEGAAKCLTSISKFNEASALLYKRNDQQYQHTACLLQSKISML